MPDIKLTMDADVSRAVRANQQLEASEAKLEAQFGRTARAATKSGEQIGQSAQQTAEVYELAAQRTEGSMLRFGASTSRRGGATRPYGMAPMPAALASAAAGAIARYGGDGIPLASEYLADSRMKDTRLWMGQQWAGMDRNRANDAARKMEAEHKAQQQSDLDLLRFQNRMDAQRDREAEQREFNAKVGRGLRVGGQAVLALGMAGAMYGEELTAKYAALGGANVAFQDTMTPFTGLSENFGKSRQLSDQMISSVIASGMAPEQIAQTKYNLLSAGANLPENVRDQILTQSIGETKVKGGDLTTNALALTKGVQNYGAELGGVTAVLEKFNRIEETAAVTAQQLSENFAQILPVGKLVGATMDQMGAALGTVSVRAGDTEQAMTGLRNFLLHFHKLREEGMEVTGDWSKDIPEAHKFLWSKSAQERQDLVSKTFEVRGAAAAMAILENPEEFARREEEMKKKPSVSIQDQYFSRLSDQSYAASEMTKETTAFKGLVPEIKMQDPELMRSVLAWNLFDAGRDLLTPTEVPSTISQASILSALVGTDAAGDQARAAMNKIFEAQVKSAGMIKDPAERKKAMVLAHAQQLLLGEVSGKKLGKRWNPGNKVTDYVGEGQTLDPGGWEAAPTGVPEMQRYLKWVGRGVDLGDNFTTMLERESTTPDKVGQYVANLQSLDLFKTPDVVKGYLDQSSDAAAAKWIMDRESGRDTAGDPALAVVRQVATMLHGAATNFHAASKAMVRNNQTPG